MDTTATRPPTARSPLESERTIRPCPGRKTPAALGFALFTVSGACGLAYEVLWARWLALFVGNTVLLHMTLLGSFMGGLTVGSLLIGRRLHAVAAPLRAYGLLEAGIAAYALAFPALAHAAATLAQSSLPATTVRLAIAACMLAPPAVLMGATYPALTAWYERGRIAGERAASGLYAANCVGAAAGAAACGIVLVPWLGMTATGISIAAVNGLVALVALGLAASQSEDSARSVLAAAQRNGERNSSNAPTPAVGGASRESRRQERLILTVTAICGAAAFLYELAWTRLFTLTLGNSTYSFTLMLAAFLCGLAAGSGAVAMSRRLQRHPLAALAVAQAALAASIAISVPLYERLPYWSWRARWLLRPVEATFGLYQLQQFGLVFLVMIGPTFFCGLCLPLAVCALSRSGPATRAAATAYGWNTLGTIVGVAIAGLVLIPMAGLQRTLQAGALLDVAAALLVAWAFTLSPGLRGGVMALAAAVVAVLVAAPSWHPLALAEGTFRQQAEPPPSWPAFLSLLHTHRVVYAAEDSNATVSVLVGPDADGTRELTLVVDGKSDASSYGDMPTQVLLGELPLCLEPSSQRVFVLGLGSGVTAASVLCHPVARVDCAELSPAVAAALPYFDDANGVVRSDPRFHLAIADGKTALPESGGSYDVIISEPPNPWVAGVGNLFSTDFYRSAASHLTRAGLMAQWFHAYEFDDRLASTVIRTFRTVFPHAVLFNSGGRDYILIGSREPIAPDFVAMESTLRLPDVARDLARVHLDDLTALLTRQTHGEQATAALSAAGLVNSDDHPVLEFAAPRAQYASAVAQVLGRTDERRSDGSGLLLRRYMENRGWSRAQFDAVLESLADVRLRDDDLEREILAACLARWPRNTGYLLRMAEVLWRDGRTGEAAHYVDRAAALGDPRAGSIRVRLRNEQAPAVPPLWH